jgi:rhodanese-related sulfurtransferase
LALVTGIFGDCDPEAIEGALKAQNLDPAKVHVVTKAAQSQAFDESPIDFIHVAKAMETNDFSDDMTHGTGQLTDSGGTGVPGVSGRGPSLSSFGSRGAGNNYFASFSIPIDQVGNYNDAVEAGRCVVTYDASGGDASTVASALRAAGFRAVRTF